MNYEEFVEMMTERDDPGFCPIDGIWSECDTSCANCRFMRKEYANWLASQKKRRVEVN